MRIIWKSSQTLVSSDRGEISSFGVDDVEYFLVLSCVSGGFDRILFGDRKSESDIHMRA